MTQCGCQDPLSGATCTETDEHIGQHKDNTDPLTIIIFGDPPNPLATPPTGTPTNSWQAWAALYQHSSTNS